MVPSSGVLALSQFGPTACTLLAVVLWGTADFSGGYASRRANAFVVTAFSHLCAFGLMFSVALLTHPEFPSRASILWGLLAGGVGGFSLAIFYRALASGQMGITAPVAALLGAAIPTLVDVAVEGAPGWWTIGGFVLAIIAIWLITRAEASEADPSDTIAFVSRPPGQTKNIIMAALAGVGFAGFYIFVHQASGSPVWIAAMSRVASFTATAVAVVVTRAPVRLGRPEIGLGMVAGFFDIIASALFIYASQHGRLDVAVVLTSLYPAVTVILARIVLKEHFSRWKLVGLVMALAAVPMIASA